jgi:glycogen debranching enzyme
MATADVSGDTASPYAGTSPVASLTSTDGIVTLVEGQSFCVSGRSGDMAADYPHGVFVFDTRILSRWELLLNGHRPEPLAVDPLGPFGAAFFARGAPEVGQADGDLVVVRHRHVGRGMRERIVVHNHGLDDATFRLELGCAADFADLFEVKERRVRRRGEHRIEVDDIQLRFGHRLDDLEREVTIRATVAADTGPDRLAWEGTIEPGGSWEVCITVATSLGGTPVEPRFSCGSSDPGDGADPEQQLASWRATLPSVDTDHLPLAETIARSAEDLGALRIFDPEHHDLAILAAGAPWFMTVFGRDSLLTAWMTLIADSSLARGVLETLARFQGTEVNPTTEEEPGRILHEMRFGASAALSLGGGHVYYGTVDATPLFVMLLAELRRWDPRDELVEHLLPHADRAIEWIEQFGDRDGDGYVEYQRSDEGGLANQGWKDSWDAVRHADGQLADGPIALSEVQGYVYAAYVGRAHLARELGDTTTFERCRTKATELRRRFNEDFWVDEHGWFALALDGDKRPVDVLSSNIGHCLWTGIVDPEKSGAVAGHLLSGEMFTGFGVRTLASSALAYNPVSYHNGSVWPHDNALCAAGLARYGHVEESNRVISSQLDTARTHQGRLPELFAGFDRRELSSPASYPTSCSPQAWAAASPLLWLRTMLRLDPSAPERTVHIDPHLPADIRRLSVSGIRIADRTLTVSVDEGAVEVETSGDLVVDHRSRPPLSEIFDAPA